MSTAPYTDTGRVAQKRRTRDALVAAARELVAAGHTPTPEAAAQRAGISRTTAYRYFPNQQALLAHAHPETVTSSLLPDGAPGDPAERARLVVEAFVALVLDTEPQQRTMLRLSLEPAGQDRGNLPLRQGRGIGWIGEALHPLLGQLSETELHRLALAVRSVIGIEALVWLTDVGGLSRTDAAALMRWSAACLVRSAMAGDPPPVPAATTRRRPRQQR